VRAAMGRKKKTGDDRGGDKEGAEDAGNKVDADHAASSVPAGAMNPLLAAAAPLLAANPLLGMSMLSNPMAMAGLRPGDLPAHSIPTSTPGVTMTDPDVQELCDYFHIEERHARRLSDIMKKRQETFVEDIERLYDVLERANSPAGLLVVKMREMEEGIFVGKAKADKELKEMAKKFKLDDQAETKLADILARYDEAKRKAYILDIERHLEVSNRPSAMAMMLLKKLGDAQPLGRPGPVAPGSYLDKANREKSGRGGGDGDRDRKDDRDRGRDRRDKDDRDQRRDRDRSRERRSRSRRR